MQLGNVAALMEVVQDCRVDIMFQCGGVLAAQPSMLQRLVRREPPLRLELHEVVDPVHRLLTDLVPDFILIVIVACNNVSLNLAVGALEWERAAQHGVGDDADRPEIAARVVVGALDDLRCHEVDGSAVSVHVDLLITVLRVLGHAEVDQFYAKVIHLA